MGDFNPSYMVDCYRCGSQLWHLERKSDEDIKVNCGECDSSTVFLLDSSSTGEECMFCNNDVWELKEHIEDEHLILECSECAEIVEVWLRGDELGSQSS